MELEVHKKIILGILILAVFAFVVSISSLYVQTQISQGNACGCFIPLPIFIPFVASIGLFIGTIIYYLFHPELERKKLPKDIIFDCFEGNEKSIIKKVLENNGEILQSGIVKNTSFTKVKVHRIIKKLVNKGIVKKESYGNTNKIKLREKIKENFS